MIDVQYREATGYELAEKVRRVTDDGGQDGWEIMKEVFARLLEQDARNHDLLASGTMKWRCLLEKAAAVIDKVIAPDEGDQMEAMIGLSTEIHKALNQQA